MRFFIGFNDTIVVISSSGVLSVFLSGACSIKLFECNNFIEYHG
ncbi:hypothetical protein FM107_18375 [Sphingobacterium sp. JB170]|nr:hypothetical protein FM107_18375 [Sphingobacterium sp. JB170]